MESEKERNDGRLAVDGVNHVVAGSFDVDVIGMPSSCFRKMTVKVLCFFRHRGDLLAISSGSLRVARRLLFTVVFDPAKMMNATCYVLKIRWIQKKFIILKVVHVFATKPSMEA